MTPFLRLALLFAATGYGFAVALIREYFGPFDALLSVALGVGLAVLVTLEFAPRPPADAELGPEAAGGPGASDAFTIRQRERRDIARTAERSRDQ